MEKLIGRNAEQEILSQLLKSKAPELVAVYGRRRVGKTFLIRNYYKDFLVFEFSGVHDAPIKNQLQNLATDCKK